MLHSGHFATIRDRSSCAWSGSLGESRDAARAFRPRNCNGTFSLSTTLVPGRFGSLATSIRKREKRIMSLVRELWA